MTADELRARIRTIPDWPKPGIQFRDITPLLQHADTFRAIVHTLAGRHRDAKPDAVAGVEARGFILGAAIAHALDVGFIPIRKQGKLPHQTLAQSYSLEYGEAIVEVHVDACAPGARVLLVDDLIATGGTMLAAAQLLRRLGASIIECAAIVDLPDLGGSALLAREELNVVTLVAFEGE